MPSLYAWIIDTDHLFNPADALTDNQTGILGPTDAPDDLLEALAAGEGREFQMLDDDGELYYTGRILVRGQTGTAWSGRADEDFGPLWDFGGPNAGAVTIRYRNAGGDWQSL